MPRLTGLWRHHDFISFWLSQSLSLLSIQVGRLALPLVAILALDASATQLGLLAGTGGIPWLVFGLAAGIGIDRRRRRPILTTAHIGRACLIDSVPVAALLDMVTMKQLYVVAFGVGTLGVCYETAYHAYLPSLVSRDQLAEANGKLAVTSGVTRVAGPVVAIAGPCAVPLLIGSRFINAFGWTIWQVHQETTQQQVTPGDLRGRVTGSSLFVVRSLEAGGGFVAAILATRMGVVQILAIGSLGALVSMLWLVVSPVRRLRAKPSPPGMLDPD